MTIVKGFDHIKLVYESTLQRIATTLETLASTPKQNVPDVSSQSAENQIVSLQSIINIIDPMIEMMQETMKEDKQIREEIKRVADKFKAEETIASIQWLAAFRETNQMDMNLANVLSLYTNFIIIGSTIKQQKTKAERKLPPTAKLPDSGQTTTTNSAPQQIVASTRVP
ncbi:MAG TPA: hypothetical protein VFV08_10915, partial [Puia sp.]|nr:hypothetical protein [Puia sp.]